MPLSSPSSKPAVEDLHETIRKFGQQADRQSHGLPQLTWVLVVLTLVLTVLTSVLLFIS